MLAAILEVSVGLGLLGCHLAARRLASRRGPWIQGGLAIGLFAAVVASAAWVMGQGA